MELNLNAVAGMRDVLEDRWYQSLEAGTPDYGVYSSLLYLAEAYGCWYKYSRRYLKDIAEKHTLFGGLSVQEHLLLTAPRVIVDVGCGLGYSTERLKELFPKAKVYGTNLPGPQMDMAERRADWAEFTVLSGTDRIANADLVFASEYFEHFERPVEHLHQLYTDLHPNAWIIANSFTARATGHFNYYIFNGNERVSSVATGRRFNLEMRKLGYEKVETGFWNNRPAYWVRAEK